ncbi:hypothetical protein V6N12_057962 [Hibiscus sabdariffa]|uniref:Uncharacterized protein n=1 Tax=Hibiscus sabdariffa TaxID=183260 RepID=A0ABR2AEE1_9ROSI
MVFWGSRCLLSPMLYDIFSLLRSDQCMHVASQSIFHAWFRVNGQLTDRPQGGKATKIDLPIQEREHATHHSQIRAAITPTLFEACPRAEKPYRTSYQPPSPHRGGYFLSLRGARCISSPLLIQHQRVYHVEAISNSGLGRVVRLHNRLSYESAYKALTPPRYPGQKKISFPEKKISRCMRSQPSLTLLFKTKESQCPVAQSLAIGSSSVARLEVIVSLFGFLAYLFLAASDPVGFLRASSCLLPIGIIGVFQMGRKVLRLKASKSKKKRPWEDELVQLDKRVAFEFPSFHFGSRLCDCPCITFSFSFPYSGRWNTIQILKAFKQSALTCRWKLECHFIGKTIQPKAI